MLRFCFIDKLIAKLCYLSMQQGQFCLSGILGVSSLLYNIPILPECIIRNMQGIIMI